MHIYVVADILEMLSYALGYRYLAYCDAEALHERDGIVVGTVGSAEAGHSDTNYSLTVVAKLVECLDTYQQRKSRVQATTYAKYHTLGACVYKAFGKTTYLNRENLIARSKHIIACRYEWMRIDATHKRKVARLYGICRNDSHRIIIIGTCLYERCVLTAFGAQLVYINLIYHELFVKSKTLRLCHHSSILANVRIATIDNILSTLAKST